MTMPEDSSALTGAARTVGSTLGKIASTLGIAKAPDAKPVKARRRAAAAAKAAPRKRTKAKNTPGIKRAREKTKTS